MHLQKSEKEILKMNFWISNGRYDPDPEAPLVVLLRGDTTTRRATSIFLV